MAHYTVALLTPTSQDWIAAYTEAVGPLVEKHGGRYLVRTAGVDRLEGDVDAPAMVVMLEWPSPEAERSFFADPTYAPHRAARQSGASTAIFSVRGGDDLAAGG